MTTVHARLIGNEAVLPKEEFNRLVELARQSEDIEVQTQTDEIPSLGITYLAEKGKAFGWLAEEPDLYSVDDLKVRYR